MSGPLPDIPGGWTEREVDSDKRPFRLKLPADPDAFLDDPAVQEANRVSDYMPYWSYLWPASIKMARLVSRFFGPQDLENGTSPLPERKDVGQRDEQASKKIRRTRTLEIGCGIGLVGIAGLDSGLDVSFSDYDETAVRLAVHNATLNQFEEPDAFVLDWREIDSATIAPFDLILACDVVYESPNHPLVLNVLQELLCQDGVCWLGDPGRGKLPEFLRNAASCGWGISVFDESGSSLKFDSEVPNETCPLNEFRLIQLARQSQRDLT